MNRFVMRLPYYFLLIIIMLSSQACEDLLFEKDLRTSDPYENFDYLWNECDRKYAFFDYKNIDWNDVRNRYRAKLYPNMKEDSLFTVLAKMLNELRDGHVNLFSKFNVSYYPIQALGQDNFDRRRLEEKYFNYEMVITGPFAHNFLSKKSVGYIRFDEFTGTVNDDDLTFILDRFKDTKGIIFDIRENGGGDSGDIFRILKRFTDKPISIFKDQLKSGPGHEEFSTLKPQTVNPHDGSLYLKKFVVLTDRSSYSAASFFILAAKEFPNCTVIGDFTGGGLGIPNGGQLPNGWIYRFSVSRTLSMDGANYESGVPPDILQNLNLADREKDQIIERAIQEILK